MCAVLSREPILDRASVVFGVAGVRGVVVGRGELLAPAEPGVDVFAAAGADLGVVVVFGAGRAVKGLVSEEVPFESLVGDDLGLAVVGVLVGLVDPLLAALFVVALVVRVVLEVVALVVRVVLVVVADWGLGVRAVAEGVLPVVVFFFSSGDKTLGSLGFLGVIGWA